MVARALKLLLFLILVLLGSSAVALASAIGQYNAVPEASATILAPMGLAAIIAAEKWRRRVCRMHQGVGAAYIILKRLGDIIMALILLMIASPAFALLALLVRLDSPGPVLFKRRVIGKDGKSFDMFKFRSMVEGAEQILEQDEELKRNYYVKCKLHTDPRVTGIGILLRKTSLDELPQLINILIGNMTFVGPRPIAADEIEKYGPAIDRFVTVTPGITGLWQTSGRSETSYDMRVSMDMTYIEKRSILLDIWIILCTVPAVLLKRGAC